MKQDKKEQESACFTLKTLLIVLAIIVGLRQNPEVFFNIPKIGFIPYIVLGGRITPFKDVEALAKCVSPMACSWLESKDVIINSCAKCGTNWMMSVVHELRTAYSNFTEDEKEFEDILDVSPWLDIFQYPGDVSETRFLTWGNKWNLTTYPFKQYKGHLYPHRDRLPGNIRQVLVPVRQRRDVKFVVMVRNPEDMIVSLVNFAHTHGEEFYRQFGMPPPNGNLDFFIFLLDNLGKSASPFNFFKHWYEYKDDPNVLLLHYTNVFRAPEKYTRIIAEFIGLEGISEQQLELSMNRTSLAFMKNRNDKYRHRVGPNKSISIIKSERELKGGGLVSKGGIGSGTAALNQNQREKLRAHGEALLSADLLKLLYEGFEWNDITTS